jgi:hypothetical protein
VRSDDASGTSWRSQGIDICDEALMSRDGKQGHEGWTELGAQRAQLLGRLAPTQTQSCHEGPQRRGHVTADHLAHGTDSMQAASHEDEVTWQGDDRNDRVRDPFARHWLHRKHFINEKHAAACSSALIRSVASTPHRAARQDLVWKLGLYGFTPSSLAELPV